MARKRHRTPNKTNYITYDDLEMLSFGSWLKKNAGTIGTIAGATIGTVVAPGIGTQLGASIGGSIGGTVSANEADKEAAEQQALLVKQQQAQAAAQAELQRQQNNLGQKTFPSVMANGGEIPPGGNGTEDSWQTMLGLDSKYIDTESKVIPTFKGDKFYIYKDKKNNGYYIYYGYNEGLKHRDPNRFELIKEVEPDTKFYPVSAPRGKYIPDIGTVYNYIYGDVAKFNKIKQDLGKVYETNFSEVASTIKDLYNKYGENRDEFFKQINEYVLKNKDTANKAVIDPYKVKEHFLNNQFSEDAAKKLLLKKSNVRGSKETKDDDLYRFGVRSYAESLYNEELPEATITMISPYLNEGIGDRFSHKISIKTPSISDDNKIVFDYDISFPQSSSNILDPNEFNSATISGKYTKEYDYVPFSLNSQSDKSTPINMNQNTKQTYETGGIINYQGQTHQGPNGGIPVDELGNPSEVTQKPPVAKVEDGEVGFTLPDKGTYVFSNKLKYDGKKTFADKAKEIQRKYKLRMKDGKITDPISEIGYNKEMMGLVEAQEAFREVSGINKEEAIKQQFAQMGMPIENNTLPIGENGIHIKPSKRGTFTSAAKKHGMGVQEFAKHVLANKDKFSTAMVKKANFARNAAEWNHKESGGSTIGLGEAFLPSLISTIGNSILINQIDKRKPEQLKVDPITAQQINLGQERNAAIEQARALEANARRNAILTGSSAGQVNQTGIQTALGLQRALGENLAKSYTTEAQFNAEAKMKADLANAQQNLEVQKYNAQQRQTQQDKLNMLRSQIANTWAQGASTYLKGRREFAALNMQSDDYQLKNEGNIFFPKLVKTPVSQSNTSNNNDISVEPNLISPLSPKLSYTPQVTPVSANKLRKDIHSSDRPFLHSLFPSIPSSQVTPTSLDTLKKRYGV